MMVEFLKAELTSLKKNPMVLLKLIKSSPNNKRVTMKSPISFVKDSIFTRSMKITKAIVGTIQRVKSASTIPTQQLKDLIPPKLRRYLSLSSLSFTVVIKYTPDEVTKPIDNNKGNT